MLDNFKFVINSKVEVFYDEGWYKSRIEDVHNDFISIGIPIREGEYIPLRKGEIIEVIYYYRGSCYKFNTVVVDRTAGKIPTIQLAYPKEVFKIQRRKYVRVPIVYSILYSKEKQLSYDKSEKINMESNLFKATMVDLSGGGLKIKLKDELKVGDILKMHIPIGTEEIIVKGSVVRFEKDEVNRINISGISFIDLEDRIREKIIRFIFKIMRNQMRKA
ncbi:PilZ domain-containing protein [Clostridium sp. SYSU_GA19001]|uniref:flagellar brake protein n=1 Tax=Clostridium caldaquaticum TaxID=2940653 RepID=UPI0020777F19|nr:flagellar brake domain-containing protein [Clostridium caldaquaticum]MCM8710987.1 PilZ domain-containing protein [Clostridium caldaquaticum]